MRPIDDRALFDRDNEREPRRHRHPRCVTPNRRAIKQFACPACAGPVFSPGDSDGDRLTCAAPACGAALITKQASDGLTVELAEET